MAEPGFLGSPLEKELAEEHGYPVLLAKLFAERWENLAREDIAAYLHPDMRSLKGLASSPALSRVIESLGRARRDKESVLFYGDYDVDGIMATATMFAASQHLGLRSNYYLPSRFGAGYGLSQDIVRKAAGEGYKLLVALDCGTSNNIEVELAHELGMDVVALDHHAPGAKLPQMPLINPHTSPGVDPLCSAGLAFSFAREWLAAEGEDAKLVDENFLEAAAIATIGDHVPLIGDGFILAHIGLERLPRTVQPGLSALLAAVGLQGKAFLTTRDILFSVVPHLNAAGRMSNSNAGLVVKMMLARSASEAMNIAQQLVRLNMERRELQRIVSDEAALQALAQESCEVLVLYKADWMPGVTGVVAARMVEMFNKPTLVLSDALQEEGYAVGSGRAPDGVDLLELVEPARELFVKLGGHSAAIGGTLPVKLVPELRSLLSHYRPKPAEDKSAAQIFELETAPAQLNGELISQLLKLQPFGEGHPAPRLRLRDALIARSSVIGKEGTTICIEVDAFKSPLRIVGFRCSHLLPKLRPGNAATLDVEIGVDNFRKDPALQLLLLGLA